MDFNLLTVLQALVEEGSVGGAATRLHLSSPAVSRSLGRIRASTGDEILVRTGRTMTRTPYALALRDQVGPLLRQAAQLLSPEGQLDVATLQRVFTVRAHDALAAMIAPRLLSVVTRSAPGVRLRFLAENTLDTDELRHGVVDLELGSARPTAPELRQEVIGEDAMVAVLRRQHPGAAGLDLAGYTSSAHVVVSRRGRLVDPVDDALAAVGARRVVIASVGTLAAAVHVVAQTDTVLTAPHRVTQPIATAFDLEFQDVPLWLPPSPIVSVWHQRSDSDAAHGWFRGLVRTAVDSLLASENASGAAVDTTP